MTFKALIADDEEHVREVLVLILSALKFEVSGKASDGDEAISLFKQIMPDIMILDENMPLKTGDEILKSLHGEYDNTCVIMLTAVSDMDTVKNCIALGVSHFIKKDTPLPKLTEIIKTTWEAFLEKRNKNKSTVSIREGSMIFESKEK